MTGNAATVTVIAEIVVDCIVDKGGSKSVMLLERLGRG